MNDRQSENSTTVAPGEPRIGCPFCDGLGVVSQSSYDQAVADGLERIAWKPGARCMCTYTWADERVTAPSRDEIVVPRDWLQAVVKLLDVMAGEGVGMEDCEDPADLAITLADHFGVGDFDDCLPALVERIANHGR